jgi:hypothetical protein
MLRELNRTSLPNETCYETDYLMLGKLGHIVSIFYFGNSSLLKKRYAYWPAAWPDAHAQ